MLKGTQVLIEDEAIEYRTLIETFTTIMFDNNYREIVIPSIWEADTFEAKIQGDTLNQMWTFKDKADRSVCLIPEATGLIQDMYNFSWKKSMKKPIRLFYVTRCFRYERPQLGRLREFTQFGCEFLSDSVSEPEEMEVKELLKSCLENSLVEYSWKDSVQRGLGYYTSNGFEAECDKLGAQKQIAGGGRYKEGIGWAIGIERLQLALR